MSTSQTIDCPLCGAPAGHPCNADAEGIARATPHAERTTETAPWSESPYGAVESGYDQP